jgi:hypothetical protein
MQQLKKEYITEQANKALSNVYASSKPEAYKLEALNKTHSMIKKQYKQYSSKVCLYKVSHTTSKTHDIIKILCNQMPLRVPYEASQSTMI